MMLKKGITHIDWMISMAIFLLFVLSIFAFFKPGAEPAYHRDYLTSIIEEKFRGEAYYSIERIPISGEVNTLEEGIEYVKLEFIDNFPVCGDKNKFRVVDTSFNGMQFYIKELNCEGPNRKGVIDVAYEIPNDTPIKVKFYLLYSDEFSPVGQGTNCITNPQPPDEVKNCVKMPSFTLGVSEIITGMNKVKLTDDFNLDGKPDSGLLGYIGNNYNDELKESWGYPLAKDFKLCIDDLLDKNCYPNNTVKSIAPDANVFSKAVKENALNSDTTLGRIYAIYIRTW